MITDLHTHTIYCDGKNTPEEMVLSAIDKGIDCLGFSAHSYTFFDTRYCMKKEAYGAYKSEIRSLKEKYAPKIKILCGIEQDFYSDMPADDFDYVIGSVHYLKKGSDYLFVDESIEILKDIIANYYGGDPYSLAEDYFDTVSKLPESTSIIGHFDLLTKFNEKYPLFDESNERYIKAYRAAIDKLIRLKIPFEVNTGAISRGYRTSSYPSIPQLEYIHKMGGSVILSSDSHSTDSLCFLFDTEKEILRKIGFRI